MIYIWRAHKFKSMIVMHISNDADWPRHGAVCGTLMEFNRLAYDPGYPYPVCKNCLRSCEDKP